MYFVSPGQGLSFISTGKTRQNDRRYVRQSCFQNPRLLKRCVRAPLADVVGQPDVTTAMAARLGGSGSLVLWGPPGTGKTTLARILGEQAGQRFVAMSAVFDGVADLRRVFIAAEKDFQIGQQTLLFIDEIHRFNKAQQDALLPVLEKGMIRLVGATTENPSFSLNGALLSRLQVLVLHPLDIVAF